MKKPFGDDNELLSVLIIVTPNIVTLTQIVTLFWPHENVTIMSGDSNYYVINVGFEKNREFKY